MNAHKFQFKVKDSNTHSDDSDDQYLHDSQSTNIDDEQDWSDSLKVYHINAFSEILAERGFSKKTLMAIWAAQELSSDTGISFPSNYANFCEFADTVDALSRMSDDEIVAVKRTLVSERTSVVNEYASMLHSLGMKGLVFVNPAKGLAFTASSTFERFVQEVTPNELTLTQAADDALKFLLESLKSILSPTQDDGLLQLFKERMFEVTSISTFKNATIVPVRLLSNTRVLNGSLKSTAPLPFATPVVMKNTASGIRKTTISRAVQDVTGLTPVSFKKGASGSQDITAYMYPRWNGDSFDQARFIAPIEIPVKGTYGDIYTTDILQQYTSDGELESPFDDVGGFAEYSKVSHFNKYVDHSREAVSFAKYTNEAIDESVETAAWLAVKDGEIVDVADLSLVRMSYSSVTYKDFFDRLSIKVIDLATYNTLMKEAMNKTNSKYVCLMVSACSQTVLAIPRQYVTNPVVAHQLSVRKPDHYAHPNYLLLFKAIGRKLPMMCSSFYLSSVMTYKELGTVSTLEAQQQIATWYMHPITGKGKKRKKSKSTQMPSQRLAERVFNYFVIQEASDMYLIPVAAAKLDAPKAFEAIVQLGESEGAFLVSEQADEEIEVDKPGGVESSGRKYFGFGKAREEYDTPILDEDYGDDKFVDDEVPLRKEPYSTIDDDLPGDYVPESPVKEDDDASSLQTEDD